ncbi:DUF4873 domain-containing protein [Actinoplanes solisilvae]|uniref:DUF4873 domain-containing protein n=1 Tax=Actinoplanes solisilvae TaxID=2486853 RepID=UPI000FD9D2AF|nr:DUF4873 domain-containing protein [Actinoplanes solisilvae]
MNDERNHEPAVGNDEEYRGPAVLTFAEAGAGAEAGDGHPVQIRMWARFEPVEGRFRWAGRTAPDAVLLERTTTGLRDARLSIGDYRAVAVRLSEPDPWGGVRLTGIGTPPWFS